MDKNKETEIYTSDMYVKGIFLIGKGKKKPYYWRINKNDLDKYKNLKKNDLLLADSLPHPGIIAVKSIFKRDTPPISKEIKEIIDYATNINETRIKKEYMQYFKKVYTKKEKVVSKLHNKKALDHKTSNKLVNKNNSSSNKKTYNTTNDDLIELKQLWMEGKGFLPSDIINLDNQDIIKFADIENYLDELTLYTALIEGKDIGFETDQGKIKIFF